MNKKERALLSIKLKNNGIFSSAYRGLPNLSIKLNNYFGFEEPENLIKNYKNLITVLGTDFYASGSKICKFTTYSPRYIGPEPVKPYIKDHSNYYQIGAHAIYGEGGKGNEKIEYDIVADPPLRDISLPSEIKEDFLIKNLKYFDFSHFENKYGDESLNYNKIINSDDEFICIGNLSHFFMICWALRGYEQFLMDLAFNRMLAEKLISLVCEFTLEYVRRELESFGNIAEYFGTADDVAGQDGMLFSPELFKKYFLNSYVKLIDLVKKHDLIFSWHCCGSVHKVLPMMVDAGIDVFDVVQTSAKDMEIKNVYKHYGKHVSMLGGIDVQKLLVFGNPEEIKKEVNTIKSLWKSDKGIIVAPSHEALPETPVKNIIALYDELNK